MVKYRSKELQLTVQQGGRLSIPSQTLKELEISDGDLVFVLLTKAVVSKALWEEEGQSEGENGLGGEKNVEK